MKIKLPDGSFKELEENSNGLDLAKSIGQRLAKDAVAITVNGELKDLTTVLNDGDEITIVTKKDDASLEVLRHTTAHLMAQAVQNLFQDAKVAIGPTIENGFYYDFDIPSHNLTPEDLVKIENEMRRIIKKGQKVERVIVDNPDQVIKKFKDEGEVYKAELLEEHKASNPTLYINYDLNSGKEVWSDLCRGPHLPDIGKIKIFKLMNIAGAYWRGDENNKMLQRIYATAFWKDDDLKQYLNRLEEAKKRDHRKIGKQLDLFSVHEDIGGGLILWHPDLGTTRMCIEEMWRKSHARRGYKTIYTPHIAKRELWDISGHSEYYMDKMFKVDVEKQEYLLKPMNCPFHMKIYQSQLRSYREFPIKWAELGTVYRYEQSGELHGLVRVRCFTQDDGHIFCRDDQFLDEVIKTVDFAVKMIELFDIGYEVELSTKPEGKVAGSDEIWRRAEAVLEEALQKYGIEYKVCEGEGAFYGPKIDFQLRDALDRVWQGATVQLDFNLPERFQLEYIDKDNKPKQPVMIHRALLGSVERFVGTLIEHYAGAFPVWCSPTQVILLSINDDVIDFADGIVNRLNEMECRVETDYRNETIGHKIREAEMRKIPYMLIIGNKEKDNNSVSVRKHKEGDQGTKTVDEFIDSIKDEIKIPVI